MNTVPGLILPELNDELRFILGRPNFMCAGIADVLRAKGADIKRKAEDEQAAVLHWSLALYLKHGDSWREQAELELSQRGPVQEVEQGIPGTSYQACNAKANAGDL